jgi:ankyrin repeat protein
VAGLLLGSGADIEAQGDGGVTPLLSACRMGRGAAVGELLRRGADATARKRNGPAAFSSWRSATPTMRTLGPWWQRLWPRARTYTLAAVDGAIQRAASERRCT